MCHNYLWWHNNEDMYSFQESSRWTNSNISKVLTFKDLKRNSNFSDTSIMGWGSLELKHLTRILSLFTLLVDFLCFFLCHQPQVDDITTSWWHQNKIFSSPPVEILTTLHFVKFCGKDTDVFPMSVYIC